jgi:hypothetical protein
VFAGFAVQGTHVLCLQPAALPTAPSIAAPGQASPVVAAALFGVTQAFHQQLPQSPARLARFSLLHAYQVSTLLCQQSCCFTLTSTLPGRVMPHRNEILLTYLFIYLLMHLMFIYS